jgi:hypothetical protein
MTIGGRKNNGCAFFEGRTEEKAIVEEQQDCVIVSCKDYMKDDSSQLLMTPTQ